MHIRPFFYILWIPVTIFTWYALSGIYKTAAAKGTNEFGIIVIIALVYLFFTLIITSTAFISRKNWVAFVIHILYSHPISG